MNMDADAINALSGPVKLYQSVLQLAIWLAAVLTGATCGLPQRLLVHIGETSCTENMSRCASTFVHRWCCC